jgi:hypothetical protein
MALLVRSTGGTAFQRLIHRLIDAFSAMIEVVQECFPTSLQDLMC